MIQVTAEFQVPQLSSNSFASGGPFKFSIDITLQSPHHLGLAAKTLTCLTTALTPYLPVAFIMTEYFKRLGWCGDAFQGGLPSYGLMIMTLLPVLQYLNGHSDFSSSNNGADDVSCRPTGPKQGIELKFPNMEGVTVGVSNVSPKYDSSLLDSLLSSKGDNIAHSVLSGGVDILGAKTLDEPPDVTTRRRSHSTPMPVTEAIKSRQLIPDVGRYTSVKGCRQHGRRVALQLLGEHLYFLMSIN